MTFHQWFIEIYPVIARALADGTAGPNERWLYQIAEQAFMAGRASA